MVPTSRPGTAQPAGKGAANYSGKRKVQCLGIQVASTDRGDPIAVSDSFPGTRHDTRVIRECCWSDLLADTDARWIADSAYTATTPVKKTPTQPRREWERKFNKTIASLQAPIEHCIARLKNWKILAKG